MQTLYFTTRNFVRTEGNVVDFAECRRRLRPCSGYAGSLETDDMLWGTAYDEAEWDDSCPEEIAAPAHTRCTGSRKGKNTGFFALSNLPELCATLAVVVMAITVVIRFIQL